MAKEGRFWFDHDYQARNDDKILELRAEFGAEGYGVFWMLIETIADSENAVIKFSLIGGLSHGYGVAKGRLSDIIKFCVSIGLLVDEHGYISSQRIKNHKEYRKSFSEDGKRGAEKRWGKNREAITTPMPPQCHPNSYNITEHKNNTKSTTVVDSVVKPISPTMTNDDLVMFQSKLIQEAVFIDQLMPARGIPNKATMLNWIKAYNIHIAGEGKLNKDYGEYKRHFKNWIVMQETNKPPPVLSEIEKVKQHNPTPYIKPESSVDFDKYRKNGV